MDRADVFNEQGQLMKADVPFVRIPLVGEVVAKPNGSGGLTVLGVFHAWKSGQPLIGVQLDTGGNGAAAFTEAEGFQAT